MRDKIIEGQTPLTPEEKEGLIPPHITKREELNSWEQRNMISANEWLARRKKKTEILTTEFVCKLHEKMFGEVWKWAGRFRTTDKNIGVSKHEIRPKLHDLLEDTKTWVEQGTYPADEIAVRFHHRLVLIHPFPNGNGRHSRKMADLLLTDVLE